MKKNNLLLEHVMLERQEMEKQKKKKGKLNRRNRSKDSKWWRDVKDDTNVELF